MHHLEASLEQTPITYIQNRFRFGKDKETAARFALTEEEEALMSKRGAINGVVERKLQVPIHIISIHHTSNNLRFTQSNHCVMHTGQAGAVCRDEDRAEGGPRRRLGDASQPRAEGTVRSPLPVLIPVRTLSLRQGTLNKPAVEKSSRVFQADGECCHCDGHQE